MILKPETKFLVTHQECVHSQFEDVRSFRFTLYVHSTVKKNGIGRRHYTNNIFTNEIVFPVTY